MLTKEVNYTSYFENARKAGRKIVGATTVNRVLHDLAVAAVNQTDYLLQEDKRDLDRMDPNDPKYDRLKLTASRIQDIANEIKHIAQLENPLGHVLSKKTMPNGLHISKVSVPLGVVGVIYEARPNV